MDTLETSAEYEAARKAHEVAWYRYDAVRRAYRARQTTDAIYIAARKEYHEAELLFDQAFRKEQS